MRICTKKELESQIIQGLKYGEEKGSNASPSACKMCENLSQPM